MERLAEVIKKQIDFVRFFNSATHHSSLTTLSPTQQLIQLIPLGLQFAGKFLFLIVGLGFKGFVFFS